jgi:hypothetical protein
LISGKNLAGLTTIQRISMLKTIPIMSRFLVLLIALSVPIVFAQTEAEETESVEETENALDTEAKETDSAPDSENADNISEEIAPPPSDGRTVKLSPGMRIIERKRSIPKIELENIQHFLSRPQILSEEDMIDSAYIIINAEESLYSTKHNQIYAGGLDDAPKGSQYSIVRFGQAYRSPLEDEEDEVLAYESVYLGEAIVEKPGQPATLKVTKAIKEIKNGDYLLPLEITNFEEDFYPYSPESLEDTYIIAVIDSGSFVAQYQLVVINKGSDDNIGRGYILTVKEPERLFYEKIADDEITLPARQKGTLLVFRVFERISYALVRSSVLPIRLLDRVTAP